MKRSKFIIGLTATALVLPLGAIAASATEVAPADATEWTEWISDDGGSAGRELPETSANGRYVVLVGRSNEFGGVWVKDRRFPARLPKQVATGFLFNPAISADGSTVAWTQYGSTGSGGQQVYYYKWRDPDAIPRIASRGDDGQVAQGVTDFPSLSGNGRYVAFQSMDMTLDDDALAGKKGGNRTKAYVRDLKTGDTEMVSVTNDNEIVNGSGMKPDITRDGRYVAFISDSTILQGIESDEEDSEEETEVAQQVYRRDRVAKTTIPVSIATGSTTSAPVFGDGASSGSYGPSISDGGLRVAFESLATNLVNGDTNEDTDAFVRLIGANKTVRVSLDENGQQVNSDDAADGEGTDDPETPEDEGGFQDAIPVGLGPAISGNGKYIAFESKMALTSDDTNGEGEVDCDGTPAYVSDVYRYGIADLSLGRWSVVDDPDDPLAFEASGCRTDGHTGETVVASNGSDPTIAADGSRIAFVSQGNLTGREVEEEEGETTEDPTAIEPSIYLHRPNPEPDITPPRSRAYSPRVDRTSPIKVTYRRSDPIFPSSGVVAVRLYVKKPGETKFYWRRTDRRPELDGVFKIRAKRLGRYRFYTRARDAQGNLEAAPRTRDTVTIRR